MMPGGYSEVNECSEDVKILATKMQEQIENNLGETFETFEPILFTCQVVAGTNYNVKIHVGDERFIHVKIYVPLPSSNSSSEILECESGKTLFDPLT